MGQGGVDYDEGSGSWLGVSSFLAMFHWSTLALP